VGIYINTANSLPVISAIEERGLLGRVQLVATDLFPEIGPLIESRVILATLHQRPFTQGKMAFETLVRYLVDQSNPSTRTRLAPHVVLRSKLPLFANQLKIEASPKS